MKTYHKIQTVWKRDPDNKNKTLLEGQWATPEFELLSEVPWEFTEKVNGTNVRVIWDGEKIRLRGKTDDAQMLTKLYDALAELLDPARFQDTFEAPAEVCLYGEGYGRKIQKGGGNYRADIGFVLFDVRIGEWWLRRQDVQDVAQKLGLDVVPVVSYGSLLEMVDRCRTGFKSAWGDFQAEGIVARPMVDLRTRRGDRIITKLKCKDFR